MSWSVTYSSTPGEHPVSLELLKVHAHVDGNDEDENLSLYIKAATRLAEKRLGRQLVTATLVEKLDCFPVATRHNPDEVIYIHKPPLQSVTSIGYVQTDGTTTTMSSSDYIVDVGHEPGRIMPRYGDVWPTPQERIGAVTVTYVAGYGSAEAVPDSIKQWIAAHAATSYRHRELEAGMEMKPLGFLDGLLEGENYGAYR